MIKPKLKSELVQKITELSGQNINLCYHCGICSGSCPNSAEIDLLPRKLMRMALMGQEQLVMSSRTPWICASCLTCTVRCPRLIDIARVMEAIRLITLRDNIDYVRIREIPSEKIASLPPIALISSFRKHTA
jgi:heterodisulfide reductase subunit C